MKRLPSGSLTLLSELTGLHPRYLSDLAATQKRVGPKRALFLEEKTGIPATVWLWGTSAEIKSRIVDRTKQ